MDSKRSFLQLLLILVLTTITSALITALPGRFEGPDSDPATNDPTSNMFLEPVSTSTGSPVAIGRANHGLKRRDFYTCYQISPSPVVPDDCQKVIERVKGHGSGSFNLLPGLCLVWMEGTCKARFCAADQVATTEHGGGRGLNQTFGWVGLQLDHLLQDCIAGGRDGLKGDCADLNSGCGFYRLHLEHRGREVLNITGSGI